MTASFDPRHCSLAFGSRHTVVDGTLQAPDVATVLGRISGEDELWSMRADGLVVGGSAALRVEARAGSARNSIDRTQGITIIGFVTGGRLDLKTVAGTAAVTTGECFFLGPGSRTALRWQEPTVMVLASVPSQVAVGVGVALEQPAGALAVETVFARPVMRFWETLAASKEMPSPLSLHFLDQLVQEQSAALLLSSEGFRDDLHVGRRGLYGRALQLMVAKRAEPLVTPASIATDLNVSLRQLQRAFREHSDAPAAALRRLRAELAQQLLHDGRYSSVPMSQVAAHSGFSSPQVMRRVLKQHGIEVIR